MYDTMVSIPVSMFSLADLRGIALSIGTRLETVSRARNRVLEGGAK
jgi:hypothetical protein